jgi:hypothetical protein
MKSSEQRAMRILSIFKRVAMVAVLAAAVPSCGPSNQELKQAKEATYNISGKEMFDIAMQVTQRSFKIELVGDSKDWFSTTPKWYTSEGASETGGAGGFTKAHDGSINCQLKVAIVSDGTHSRVIVKAIAGRYKQGMSALETFNDEDPSKPGWVNGKADNLAFEIWQAAKKFQTTTAPGATAPMVPVAPATAPVDPAPPAPQPATP